MRRPQRHAPPPPAQRPQGYPTAHANDSTEPYYMRDHGFPHPQHHTDMPSHYSPNPLAAYSLPPSLPRFSHYITGRRSGRAGISDRRNSITNYESPRLVQASDHVSSDDEPDDQPDLHLPLKESLENRGVQVTSSDQAPPTTKQMKTSPYTETIERIHHSTFREDLLQHDEIAAQLTTLRLHLRPPSTESGLFDWFYVSDWLNDALLTFLDISKPNIRVSIPLR